MDIKEFDNLEKNIRKGIEKKDDHIDELDEGRKKKSVFELYKRIEGKSITKQEFCSQVLDVYNDFKGGKKTSVCQKSISTGEKNFEKRCGEYYNKFDKTTLEGKIIGISLRLNGIKDIESAYESYGNFKYTKKGYKLDEVYNKFKKVNDNKCGCLVNFIKEVKAKFYLKNYIYYDSYEYRKNTAIAFENIFYDYDKIGKAIGLLPYRKKDTPINTPQEAQYQCTKTFWNDVEVKAILTPYITEKTEFKYGYFVTLWKNQVPIQ